MAKTFCELDKSNSPSERKMLRKRSEKAEFTCEKCGRSAARKKWLCKPAKIS